MNTLVGLAVADNKLKVTDSAAQYYPGLSGGGKEKDTDLDHLLRMSSGLFIGLKAMKALR
ncbi:MAG: hypothetical protein U1F27_01020 [Turneriella sp.]